ncbi:hypothetical protein J6590_027554 [Homalodisca vitripennis]|nr:hypothetical protein J6590_027554 [Homalodisca vitripennis]
MDCRQGEERESICMTKEIASCKGFTLYCCPLLAILYAIHSSILCLTAGACGSRGSGRSPGNRSLLRLKHHIRGITAVIISLPRISCFSAIPRTVWIVGHIHRRVYRGLAGPA